MLYATDFETITDPSDCRVWAYGICEVGNPDNFLFGNSLDDFMGWCRNEINPTCYFHNLKFDGEFILHWLFEHGFQWTEDRRNMFTGSFTTLISDKGQFYSLEICFERKGKKTVRTIIYDSLKILPFSVAAIAKGFDLPLSKLEIDYDEYRAIDHPLTPIEVDYVRADVEIMARALHILFEQGLNKMTQGSNALANFKQTVGNKNFIKWFPPPAYDSDIRQSYKGGFTYCVPQIKDKDIEDGIVLDVNSLYPSVMYYQPLPYGEGKFFDGKYIEDNIYTLYVQTIKCQFTLKNKRIPMIQLKNNLSFTATEYLTSSDGEEVTLCLTSVDLKLFLEHYDTEDLKYISGWKFKATTGLFTSYIDYWNNIKTESTINGNIAMRTLAKLMLNALYGKFALNPKVQGKYPIYSDNLVKYKLLPAETREPIYIPVGTFITAWARYKTISSAQQVYDRFLYADTDSLHLTGTELPDCLDIDPVKLGAWKHESTFTRARFLRQKSYIEEIDGELHITCAGMPARCYEHVTWDNFHCGTRYKGKLQMTHVKGGIVLKDIDFTIKK